MANDLAEVVFPVNLLLQIDVLFLEPIFQRFYFRISPLKRPLCFLAFFNFKGELHVCLEQITCSLLYRFFKQFIVNK